MSEAAPAPSGSSILTSGIPPSAPPAAGNGGTPPAGAQSQTSIVTEVTRPEWAPEKYWDSDKKVVRYEDMAKGYTHLEKLLGSEKVPVPQSDDDVEAWERFYKAAGRPDDINGYEFQRPGDLPEGLPYDEDAEANFKQWAFANGLSKKQANNLYEGYVKHQVNRHSAWFSGQKQQREAAEADLRRELGSGYEAGLTEARVAMQRYADAEAVKYIDQSGLGNDPRFIRMMMRIGKEMNGDTRLSKSDSHGESAGDVRSKMAEHRKKYDAELRNPEHPSHKLRVDQLFAMHQMLSGLNEGNS